MNENEKSSTEDVKPTPEVTTPPAEKAPEVSPEVTPTTETSTPATADAEVAEAAPEVVAATQKKLPIKSYAIAALVVGVIILGALYLMEKEGRSKTNIFGSIIASQQEKTVVAVVNGEDIVNADLKTSIQQFSQAAAAQGVDMTSANAQAEVRGQALDVLINTELLKQDAYNRGLSVTDEQAIERLDSIIAEIGGEEVLAERMEVLGIDREQLQSDIKDEILIQSLLELIFEEAEITVTDEEVAAIYSDASAGGAELPALEEVVDQIKEQISTGKEQAAIDQYLAELKEEAEIDLK